MVIFSVSSLTSLLARSIAIASSMIVLASSLSLPAYAGNVGNIVSYIVRTISPSPPKRGPGGGKGDEIILSPGVWVAANSQDPATIWNLRPAILYQRPTNTATAPDRLELIDATTQKAIQVFDVKDKSYAILSVETDLKPNQSYQIHQFKQNHPNQINQPTQFQTMNVPQRMVIARELAKLDRQYANQPEELQRERAALFVKKGLWSDALQELSQSIGTKADWQELLSVTVQVWQRGQIAPAAQTKSR